MSLPSGSKWMSDAPSSTPFAITPLTSLITGASPADSRISVTSPPVSSSSSSIASAIEESSWVALETAASMSSAEATAGRTSRPVMIEMSSTARTLVGSDIATSSVSSPTKATGIAP